MIITHQHFKTIEWDGEIGYCNPGGRKFFASHGLDWNEFRKNGLPEELLLATGDEMAIKLVEHARSVDGKQ